MEKYINPFTDFGGLQLQLQKLFQVAEIAKYSAEDRQAYQNSLKYYRDIKNVLDTAFEEGLAEGMEKGVEIGIEKGVEIGIEKGVEIGIEKGGFQKAKAMALLMIKEGEPNEKIAKYTSLSIEYIEELRKTA